MNGRHLHGVLPLGAVAVRVSVVAVLILVAGCADTVELPPGKESALSETPAAGAPAPITRAATYLWRQQADDGGWHSETYALLRSGQALTPFVLHTLLQVPEDQCVRPDGGVERALTFMRRHINQVGALGLSDPEVAEYPNYSSAYALRCFLAVGDPQDADLIRRMQKRLAAAQFSEQNGFAKSSPAYGGWGFDSPLRDGEPGHMDLAHTRRALDALRDAGAKEGVFDRAQQFLRMVQRHPDDKRPQPVGETDEAAIPAGVTTYDGGFYFSPIVLAANKGRQNDETPHWRSYATATCDGILALLAAGVPPDDLRVTDAASWLKDHPQLDYPEGVPTAHPEPWGAAIRYYHFAVRGEVYRRLNWSGDWRDRLQDKLAKRQDLDGVFINQDSGLMKEDDPLLCTTLALVALASCQR